MNKERELLARVLGSRTFMQGVALRREIEELLTQPEQNNTQYLLEQVSRLTAENAMLKEKWSQPKREPLSDAEINDLDNEVFGYISKDMFRAVVRLIRKVEKAHGIGDGE